LIYPDQLAEYARNGIPAQQELSILYTRYQNRLRELNWADPEGLSWLAVEVLKKQADIVSSIQLLAVDGFDSFTGAQRKTLQLLSTQVNEMLITFPGEMNSRRPAHRRFTTMLATLQQELSAQVISLEGQPRLSPETLHLEQHVFDADEKIFPSKVSPFLVEARSPEEEARESLRWIKARVVRDQISLTECAIFTPSPDVYNPLLRLVAVEFGIPIRFTQSESLNASPAIAAFMNLLALPAQNFKARTLLNILRSPYFDFGLDNQTVDALEKIGRVARIVEGRKQWDETWLRLVPSAAEQLDLDEELSLPGLPHGVEAEALKSSLTNFFTSITPPVQSMSQTDWLA
jgi:ATP-dependent helicase/DNAse subunit B